MCGISGEFAFHGRPVDPANVKRMSDALAHRGPDAEGQYCDGPIGLGHRRLSIIDLSESGNQPLWNDAQTLGIVYNGEIYNYREVRTELETRGVRFRTGSDTEVIVKAIETLGLEAALNRFIGMFAFALWDTRARQLTLVRDRAGVKPLYYAKSDERLLFASEMKGLLAHPSFDRRLNGSALGQALVLGYAVDEATPFAGAQKLPAAHYMTVDADGAVKVGQYWSLDNVERGSFRGSYEEATEQLQALFESAFAYRLVADVPVGMFHSGGVDSSLVSAIIAKRVGADIQNITIGFEPEVYDEAPIARQISRSLGVRHLVHYVSETEVQHTLERFTEIFDEPFGDTSGIPTYILSKIARQHVKVALSADGGDEQFCGYESYGAYSARNRRLQAIPRPVRQLAAHALRLMPYRAWLSQRVPSAAEPSYTPQVIARYEKMLRLLPVASDGELVRLMHEFAFAPGETSAALGMQNGNVFAATALAPEFLARYRGGLLDTMMRTDFAMYLRDDILVKVDRASMAVSLECREPLLDHRIAEFAFSLPVDYLYSHGQHKRILRTIARQWIADDLLNRPKRGFVIPLYYWLKGVWKPKVMEFLSRPRVAAVGILDPAVVEAEVKRFYGHEGHRAERIWMLMNVQLWAEQWQLSA